MKYQQTQSREARLSPIIRSGGAVALVVSLALTMIGCDLSTESAAKQIDGPARSELEVDFDWSGSADRESMKEFSQSFIDLIPVIVEQYLVSNFTARQFGKDGWNAPKIASIDFPLLQQADVGEAGSLMGKVKKEKEVEMLTRHRSRIREHLSGIDAEKLTAPADLPEPVCTDLNGVLRRMAVSSGKLRRIFIVVTDGHESCTDSIAPLNPLSGGSALVVVLLPEESQANVRTLNYEQYEKRSAEFRRALPWAVIIPPFEDLSKAIAEARVKSANAAFTGRPDASKAGN